MMHFFKIEGAVIAPDLHLLNFTNVKLPGWKDLDEGYTEGLLDGKYTWASKDGKRYDFTFVFIFSSPLIIFFLQ